MKQIQTGIKFKTNPDLGEEALYLKKKNIANGEWGRGEMVIMGEVDLCKRSSIHQICKHHKCQAEKDFSFYRGINLARKNWVWGSGLSW